VIGCGGQQNGQRICAVSLSREIRGGTRRVPLFDPSRCREDLEDLAMRVSYNEAGCPRKKLIYNQVALQAKDLPESVPSTSVLADPAGALLLQVQPKTLKASHA